MKMDINLGEFLSRVSAFKSLPITRAWKGYGSTIFLDFGEHTYSETDPNGRPESCIQIDWDWRLECNSEIICGSSNFGPDIAECLESIEGETIEEVTLDARPYELIIGISNGLRIKSMAMVSGSPQWRIRFSDGIWVSCESDKLLASDGSDSGGITLEDKLECQHSELASNRWGSPIAEPKLGKCKSCRFYVKLAGSFHFLDFGVCSCSKSVFDGKVTNVKSGCPEHEPIE